MLSKVKAAEFVWIKASSFHCRENMTFIQQEMKIKKNIKNKIEY